jgi:hypothetical protein
VEKYSIKLLVCINEGLLDGGGIALEKVWMPFFYSDFAPILNIEYYTIGTGLRLIKHHRDPVTTPSQ